jgi:DNA-binding CsgD family transcriptional regulator
MICCKIFEGLTTKQMAEQLFIAVSTVKTHIRNIYLKLDVINRSAP